MGRTRGLVRRWWLAGVAIGAFVIALSALAVAYPALQQTQEFAAAGKAARERQCRILPVTNELFAGAAHYGIISRHDLRVYQSITPHCPAPRK